jgi:hypothetical protein
VADAAPAEPRWLGAWDLQRRYGPWDGLTPRAAADLFAGAPFRWWICGGWSLDDPASPARIHEDTDVSVLARDLDQVREWLADWHVWEAHGGLTPLLPGEEPRPGREQWWVRRDAWSPWVLDVLHSRSDGDDWLYKRDERVRRPLAEVVRGGADGVPYAAPEVTLLHKAPHSRDKDVADLERVWPTLDVAARTWLRESVALAHPDSAWVGRLDRLDG